MHCALVAITILSLWLSVCCRGAAGFDWSEGAGYRSRGVNPASGGKAGFTSMIATGITFTNRLSGDAYLTNAVAHNGSGLAIGDVDGNGKFDLVVDFGSLYGIWIWRNNDSWAPLHPLSSSGLVTGDLDGNGKAEVIVDFGPSYGVWLFRNSTDWVPLHPLSPADQ